MQLRVLFTANCCISLAAHACRCYKTDAPDSVFVLKHTQLLDQGYLGKPANCKSAEAGYAVTEELVACMNLEVEMLQTQSALSCSVFLKDNAFFQSIRCVI